MALVVMISSASGNQSQLTIDGKNLIITLLAKDASVEAMVEAAKLRNNFHYELSLYVDFLETNISYENIHSIDQVEALLANSSIEIISGYHILLTFKTDVNMNMIYEIFGNDLAKKVSQNLSEREYYTSSQGLPPYILQKMISPESHADLLNICKDYFTQKQVFSKQGRRVAQLMSQNMNSLNPDIAKLLTDQFKEKMLNRSTSECPPLSDVAIQEMQKANIYLPTKAERRSTHSEMQKIFQDLKADVLKELEINKQQALEVEGSIQELTIPVEKLTLNIQKEINVTPKTIQENPDSMVTVGEVVQDCFESVDKMVGEAELFSRISFINKLIKDNFSVTQSVLLYTPFDTLYDIKKSHDVKIDILPENQDKPQHDVIDSFKLKKLNLDEKDRCQVERLTMKALFRSEYLNQYMQSEMSHLRSNSSSSLSVDGSDKSKTWYERAKELTKYYTNYSWLYLNGSSATTTNTSLTSTSTTYKKI